MNKKAISPLIATVLLIGFAVALAAVVMTWGGGFIKSTTEQTSATTEQTLMCATQLKFEIIPAGCGYIRINNNGNVAITGIVIRPYKGGQLGTPKTDPVEIEAFGSSDEIGIGVTDYDKIEVIAKIMTEDGKEITCGDAPVEKAIICPEAL